jgi:hypothetical protein
VFAFLLPVFFVSSEDGGGEFVSVLIMFFWVCFVSFTICPLTSKAKWCRRLEPCPLAAPLRVPLARKRNRLKVKKKREKQTHTHKQKKTDKMNNGYLY